MPLISSPEPTLTRKRVVVTGMGAVNPLGVNLAETCENLFSGLSTASEVARFNLATFPSRFACQVGDQYKIAHAETLVNCGSTRREVQFGFISIIEAVAHAGLDAISQVEALVFGAGMGTDEFEWLLDISKNSPARLPRKITTHPSELVNEFRAQMGSLKHSRTIHTACASSAEAIGEAFDLIASGQLKTIIAGGADSMIEPLQFAGLSLLGALSTSHADPKSAYKPFDVHRDGFIFGEGAAALVLEEYETAIARGASIICEILGYGITQSAYRITDLNESGVGPREALQLAALDSGISLDQIDYVNAHGTGTVLNDRIESSLILELCPQAAVSSTKSMTGHMIAAAGAMEACLTALVIQKQILPPSLNIDVQDPECPIHLTPKVSKPAKIEYALSNSIGFGGTNVCIILKRWNNAP
ncbi:MAG: beta-ketoacyl-[acyl-carrier-protein] synthase family protein [Proteobacteria bacterium]|nr:beta-ketoacyl-[acyl-carrier-protein] synthase family protein [Pseudomonadota bacterium]